MLRFQRDKSHIQCATFHLEITRCLLDLHLLYRSSALQFTEPIPQLLGVVSFAHFPDPLLLRFPLGLEARGDAGLEGVTEVPPQAQRRVVLEQPRVDARSAAGGEVGSLAERAAAAAAAAAAGPPGGHHLFLVTPVGGGGGGDGEVVAGVSRLRAWGRGCGVKKGGGEI